MIRTLTISQQVERSLTKKYRSTLWNPFIGAIKRYRLIEAGDRIAVCISGGKDSLLLAKLMQLLQRHSEVPFELVYLAMDPGYRPEHRQQLEENARLLELPLTVFTTNIFEVVAHAEKSPCYQCARMRRGHLYHQAQLLGCNKIALGHHLNDVIETTLMSMLYGSQLQGMMPKLSSQHYPGMELIRPLYAVREQDILAWQRYNHLTFLPCACRLTQGVQDGSHTSKRQEVKQLIAQLKKTDPDVEISLFHSLHNVHTGTLPGTAAPPFDFPTE